MLEPAKPFPQARANLDLRDGILNRTQTKDNDAASQRCYRLLVCFESMEDEETREGIAEF